MAGGLTGKVLHEKKLEDAWVIYSVIASRPKSFVDVVSEMKVKNQFPTPAPSCDVDIQNVLRELIGMGLIHRPEPTDAHLPFQGYETKPEGHWKYYVRKRISRKKLKALMYPKKESQKKRRLRKWERHWKGNRK